MVTKEALLRKLETDYTMRDVALNGIPEIRNGNPVRSNIEKIMQVTKKAIEADTTTSSYGTIDYQLFPLIRRIFADEIAFDLVTMQPMIMPTGKIFWINDIFADAEAGGDPDAISAGDRMDQNQSYTYGDSTETATTIKRVGQTIAQVTIDTAQKKLKANWTVESQQDMKAYMGLNVESEHVRIISEEFRREQGYWIIKQFVDGATAGNVNWNVSTTSTLDTEIVAHNNRIYESIVSANNLVFKKIFRNINFIIGDVDAIARLEKIRTFTITEAPAGASATYVLGRHLVGTISMAGGNVVSVYKDPWFPTANTLLCGYKGPEWQSAGAFWAPYIPIWFTPTFWDPDDINGKKGAITRYGKRADNDSIILDGNYYATVTFYSS